MLPSTFPAGRILADLGAWPPSGVIPPALPLALLGGPLVAGILAVAVLAPLCWVVAAIAVPHLRAIRRRRGARRWSWGHSHAPGIASVTVAREG